ncbi:MAG: hypothetical protein HN909_07320 [Phycisphaerales bacterium]|jgi:hypothetical protein|nr:hypothetical protein [Phycisphaerales bacterium]MBT7171562.1 hypothetical protein [Phycisphaerales bacterium]
MKKAALLFTILAATLLGGCDVNTMTHNGGRGMVTTPYQRQQRLGIIDDYNSRQLLDDLDLFWLNDGASHLSHWQIYIR